LRKFRQRLSTSVAKLRRHIHEPGIEHAFGADFRGLFVIPVNDG